jgi:hypothetical protein
MALLERQLDASSGSQSSLPRADMQSEVFRVLLHQWIVGKGPMTSDWIAKAVGCSYRTVAATIEKLGPVVERLSDRRVRLKYFPREAWSQFVAVSKNARAATSFCDRSDQPRSPESLVRRLQKLGRSDVAIGGVIGAKRYFAELDIVGAPRLDLCIHAPGKHADLGFVQQLDPALSPTSDPHEPPRLAVHFLRRKESFFTRDSGGIWADPVECLADLIEARLDTQAFAFEAFLSEQGAALRGGT